MGIVEYLAGDNEYKYERAALVLRTLGWLSIFWGCLLSIYIWMGLKAGSVLWLWWTVGMWVAGIALIGIAQPLHRRQAHLVGRLPMRPMLSTVKMQTHSHPVVQVRDADTGGDKAA